MKFHIEIGRPRPSHALRGTCGESQQRTNRNVRYARNTKSASDDGCNRRRKQRERSRDGSRKARRKRGAFWIGFDRPPWRTKRQQQQKANAFLTTSDIVKWAKNGAGNEAIKILSGLSAILSARIDPSTGSRRQKKEIEWFVVELVGRKVEDADGFLRSFNDASHRYLASALRPNTLNGNL